MFVIISYTTHIVNIIQINVAKHIFIALYKAQNPMLANMLFKKFQNQIHHKLKCWKQAANWKNVNTFHKLHFHVPSKIALSLQNGNYLNNLFCLKATTQNGSVNHMFSGSHTKIQLLLASQISNHSWECLIIDHDRALRRDGAAEE